MAVIAPASMLTLPFSRSCLSSTSCKQLRLVHISLSTSLLDDGGSPSFLCSSPTLSSSFSPALSAVSSFLLFSVYRLVSLTPCHLICIQKYGMTISHGSRPAEFSLPPIPVTELAHLHYGIGGIRKAATRKSVLCRPKYGRHVSGALVEMNIFARVSRVIKSYVNAVLSLVEDPEKILEQTVVEMNHDLTKMRQATAQVLASQKQLENKYKTVQRTADDWHDRARLALAKGDEDLAREALKRRKSYSDNANALRVQLDQQKNVVENLVSNTRLLEGKIQEAKSKKDILKARAQSAKTATKVTEILSNVNTSSALSAFEKMEEKVLAMESQAEALNQLATDGLEGKFALLDNSSVDEDLSKLKIEISGRVPKGELPAGRTIRRSDTNLFDDLRIEEELNELKSRARDI